MGIAGYTYDGEFYCSLNCLPEGLTDNSEGVNVVFESEEWCYYPTCGSCQEVCKDVGLNEDE